VFGIFGKHPPPGHRALKNRQNADDYITLFIVTLPNNKGRGVALCVCVCVCVFVFVCVCLCVCVCERELV